MADDNDNTRSANLQSTLEKKYHTLLAENGKKRDKKNRDTINSRDTIGKDTSDAVPIATQYQERHCQ